MPVSFIVLNRTQLSGRPFRQGESILTPDYSHLFTEHLKHHDAMKFLYNFLNKYVYIFKGTPCKHRLNVHQLKVIRNENKKSYSLIIKYFCLCHLKS